MNYENRNATSEYTTQDIVYSYSVATVAAIGSALVIRRALSSYSAKITGPVGYIFNSFSTFWALSISGFLNAWIMRRTEMQKGIDVLEPETMEPVGVSKNCA